MALLNRLTECARMGFYDIITTVAALVAVLAMILLSRSGWQVLARLRGPVRNNAGLALDGSLALDARRRLSVISCHGRKVLLLTGGPSDVVVGWLPEPGTEDQSS
ncbi:hypothetical protein [Acetobacter fallax]|uniref:Flagellar biosynthesis protein FliO n=1 Tax=Acetobacter fallax TaxID=1737473 RepID=A0ABX0K673_9PROT|nr:hypothetical protein [Acetobacter fallax]NHO31819.1 hypothetical protein [Acetobacter fallax]NHO35418.1 hypothetical protein [Acetobacter fallax]